MYLSSGRGTAIIAIAFTTAEGAQITIQYLMVTPEMAQEWLDGQRPNRKVAELTVERLAELILVRMYGGDSYSPQAKDKAWQDAGWLLARLGGPPSEGLAAGLRDDEPTRGLGAAAGDLTP